MTKKAARLTAEEIQALVGQDESSDLDPKKGAVEVKKVEFAELEELDLEVSPVTPEAVEFLWDVPLTVEVVLGTTSLAVRDVLEIGPGSVIELDKAYGDPVDIFLNGRLVGRGDVVIVGDQFGVKITEILVSGEEMEHLSQSSS